MKRFRTISVRLIDGGSCERGGVHVSDSEAKGSLGIAKVPTQALGLGDQVNIIICVQNY